MTQQHLCLIPPPPPLHSAAYSWVSTLEGLPLTPPPPLEQGAPTLPTHPPPTRSLHPDQEDLLCTRPHVSAGHTRPLGRSRSNSICKILYIDPIALHPSVLSLTRTHVHRRPYSPCISTVVSPGLAALGHTRSRYEMFDTTSKRRPR